MQCNMMNVSFYAKAPVADESIACVVVAVRYLGKWLMIKNSTVCTWEIPNAERQVPNSLETTAKQLVHGLSGAENAEMRLVGYFSAPDGSYGALYFTELTNAITVSNENVLVTALPEELTYPQLHSKLFLCVQEWLNMQSSCDELWDIYDENRNFTGRTHRRGEYLEPGDYHLVVYVWMRNSKGQFLLTKRSPNKGFPNMWETTGGSAIAGDDSLKAALREVREETGLILNPKNGAMIHSYSGNGFFADVWLFQQDFDLKDVVLLEGETCDVGYFSKDDIIEMQNTRNMVPYRHLSKLFDYISAK